ncbi:MAG: glycosyltransferase family 4 protein [bacterium]|nr:glycosyltransferase family 4 protein [bacterium]
MIKNIGTNKQDYIELRTFIDLPHGFKFITERDLFSTVLNVYFHFTGKIHPFLQFLHLNIGFGKTKLKHYFNTISLSKTPWIVTFETTLPRLGNAPKFFYNFAVKKLASDNCKKIIAISQCAYDTQVEYLKKNYPEYLDIIVTKMIVSHPSQSTIIKKYELKDLPNKQISFTIAGNDFFRKGGREILNVFDELIPQYPELILNIVSSMNYGDYASKTSVKDYNKAMKIIKKYPCNIKLNKKLEYKKLINLYKSTHVGLLPTYGDSYGLSVLDSQACGCPVITSDLRALTEINNNDVGWVIKVPKLKNGNGKISTTENRRRYQEILETKLMNIMNEILNNNDLIKTKGKLALEKIAKDHNIETSTKQLRELYEKNSNT